MPGKVIFSTVDVNACLGLNDSKSVLCREAKWITFCSIKGSDFVSASIKYKYSPVACCEPTMQALLFPSQLGGSFLPDIQRTLTLDASISVSTMVLVESVEKSSTTMISNLSLG
ncbi:hypothetical protein VCR9J2_1330037 [Vibrio crassostreae]|nr:hypothetical protein VCR9J2_1330037 [Vibrio crassostreae]